MSRSGRYDSIAPNETQSAGDNLRHLGLAPDDAARSKERFLIGPTRAMDRESRLSRLIAFQSVGVLGVTLLPLRSSCPGVPSLRLIEQGVEFARISV
jgi:hypothetical protein